MSHCEDWGPSLQAESLECSLKVLTYMHKNEYPLWSQIKKCPFNHIRHELEKFKDPIHPPIVFSSTRFIEDETSIHNAIIHVIQQVEHHIQKVISRELSKVGSKMTAYDFAATFDFDHEKLEFHQYYPIFRIGYEGFAIVNLVGKAVAKDLI